MRTLKNSLQSDRFKLKSRTEYENLIKTPIYTKADIRIKFPNEIILEGIFLLRETIGDIHNFIKDCLINPNEKFYLSTSPPLKRYTNLSATIQSLGLYPSTLLYINFPEIDFMKGEHSGNFLKPEVIEKLKQNF